MYLGILVLFLGLPLVLGSLLGFIRDGCTRQ